MAAKEWNLQPHIFGITIGFLLLDALVEAHGVAGSMAHQMWPVVVSIAKKVVVGYESIERLPDDVYVQWLLRHSKSKTRS